MESGRNLVSKLAREGAQSGTWQQLARNTDPRAANRSMFGVWIQGSVTPEQGLEVVHGDEQHIGLFVICGRRETTRDQKQSKEADEIHETAAGPIGGRHCARVIAMARWTGRPNRHRMWCHLR